MDTFANVQNAASPIGAMLNVGASRGMKWAIMTDIHGNAPALRAVLSEIDAAGDHQLPGEEPFDGRV